MWPGGRIPKQAQPLQPGRQAGWSVRYHKIVLPALHNHKAKRHSRFQRKNEKLSPGFQIKIELYPKYLTFIVQQCLLCSLKVTPRTACFGH